MGKNHEHLPLGLAIALMIIVIFSMVLCYGWIDDQCASDCTQQYGSEWGSRVTHTEYSSICDCIGPEGDIKAPRR